MGRTAGRVFRCLVIILLAIVVAMMTGWATCAIYYSNLPGHTLRTFLSVIFAVLTVTSFMVLPRRGRMLTWFFILFIVIIALWRFIPASNDRDWQRDVAILPYATLNRDEITIHSIRNLNYRTEKDFDVRYYDRAFNINKLDLSIFSRFIGPATPLRTS